MKKILFTGIILVLVMMFVVTCEEEPEIGVEYTDVEYSPDRSEVTLYLDGKGVPVTPAQRAINKNMAMMAYDYFEVIFVGGSDATAANNTARTAWELGFPAGINNVPRGAGGGGINYAYATSPTSSATVGVAAMFVGRKDGKTLFGVGFITNTRGTQNGGANIATTIDGYTTSVTFSINAIQTGLLAKNEAIDDNDSTTNPTNPPEVPGVMYSSFAFLTGASGGSATTIPTVAANSERVTLGGNGYPKYTLPAEDGKTVNATYTFSYFRTTGTPTYVPTNYIKHIKDANDAPQILKRVPRFAEKGRYREPGDRWTTLTKVGFNDTSYGANTTSFTPVVPIQFTMQGTGIFSFYIQIPVYLYSKELPSFGGTYAAETSPYTTYETWYIRSGVGSEIYCLDDGIANGGCVFMQVGGSASTTTWLDIDWKWL